MMTGKALQQFGPNGPPPQGKRHTSESIKPAYGLAAGLQVHDLGDCIIQKSQRIPPGGLNSGIKMVNTRELLLDYMKYRFENAGFDLVNHRSGTVRHMFACVGALTASNVNNIIADLGNKIESDHSNKHFLERPIAALDLSRPQARADYFAWLNQLFRDKVITWGRLALVIVFSARLAEKALRDDQYERIHNICDWCCQYFVYNMFEEWILTSGGWDKLPPVDAAKTLSLLKRMPDRETVAYSTLAFLAAFTMGVFLTR